MILSAPRTQHPSCGQSLQFLFSFPYHHYGFLRDTFRNLWDSRWCALCSFLIAALWARQLKNNFVSPLFIGRTQPRSTIRTKVHSTCAPFFLVLLLSSYICSAISVRSLCIHSFFFHVSSCYFGSFLWIVFSFPVQMGLVDLFQEET